jgi:hypothetical protein
VKSRINKTIVRAGALLIALLLLPNSLLACAVCYGQSDSPLAKGMNWGIAVLMCCILSVLCSIVVFFVHVGRQSSKLDQPPAQNQTEKPRDAFL